MSRSRLLFFLLSALLVLPLLTSTFLRAADDDEEDSIYKYLSVFTEVLGLVRQAYVEPVDMDELMDGAFRGTSDALDPFSVYVPAEQVESFLKARKVGTRHSGLLLIYERGIAYVAGVTDGSPAVDAGIKVGDIVARIQSRSTQGMTLWELQQMLAGAPGTAVDVEFLRQGERHEASFELRSFEAPGATYEEIRGVGVLRIASFEVGTVEEVARILAAEAQNHSKLLIDVRGVAMGVPTAAYQLSELFASGELGALVGRGGTVQAFSASAEPRWQGEIAILVDRGTVGAAEILATVLRQKLGAGLVGEKTFGYAGRQELAVLSSGAYLVLADAFYAGPDLEPLDKGLEPDHLVNRFALRFEERDSPLEDLILERGLRYILGEEDQPEKSAA
jgi:carboxyl-terminal processing protease